MGMKGWFARVEVETLRDLLSDLLKAIQNHRHFRCNHPSTDKRNKTLFFAN
jgi:hypothetical protein